MTESEATNELASVLHSTKTHAPIPLTSEGTRFGLRHPSQVEKLPLKRTTIIKLNIYYVL